MHLPLVCVCAHAVWDTIYFCKVSLDLYRTISCNNKNLISKDLGHDKEREALLEWHRGPESDLSYTHINLG